MNRPCVENRSPDISTNFYLTAALSLAAGLSGINDSINPGPPWNENLYEIERSKLNGSNGSTGPKNERVPQRLPRTLIEALDAFEIDTLVEQTFGHEFRDIYVRHKTKEWERGFYRVGHEEREEMLDFV